MADIFHDRTAPRLYGIPSGADFPAEVIHGLTERLGDAPPQDWAGVEIFVNTARMQRRMKELLAAGPARLLPRIRLVTDPALTGPITGPRPVSALRRRLDLAQLVSALVASDPSLAPKSAIHDLADSLAELLDEMEGEGVPAEALSELDVSDESGHWARALRFVEIARNYADTGDAPSAAARQRQAVIELAARWEADPPQRPTIVAGSTGSRGTTALLMEAVAKLPQGAIILPGFDFDLPPDIWDRLKDPLTSEDHPQYRFAKLARDLDMPASDVVRWSGCNPVPDRNRLISLSLRPAPVTDQWMSEGHKLRDLDRATEAMTLIEAASPRQEALAIALCLRKAAEDGRKAALITPDRMLTRQVTAALDRWRIEPDDSAGRPLALSAPGRFLRQVVQLLEEPPGAEALLAILKHPLCHSGSGGRGPHLRRTRELELWLRRFGPPFLSPRDLSKWAEKRGDKDREWADWVGEFLSGRSETRDLCDHVAAHLAAAERLASGPADGDSELWQAAAGREASVRVAELVTEAPHGGAMPHHEYRALFETLMNTGEVRDPVRPHPNIMIWGTLEARVQGADLVILGGLSDRVWPELPSPDPWLNRRMRQAVGLLLPDRRIGLSAHDFQQAVAAPEVILTRATRDAEAETVVSRWLNRLLNLLAGLPDQGGVEALAAMRQRGAAWLALAEASDADMVTATPAPRPAPRPPVEVRPRQLSVTEIQKLIRDPYSVYAGRVLRLRRLDPLRPEPDAPLRGTILHDIFETYIGLDLSPTDPQARDRLMDVADAVLASNVPWPTARLLWRARIERVADWFIAGEVTRQAEARPLKLEGKGLYPLPGTDFMLSGKADRIDRRQDGRLLIYDYKTGAPPTDKVVAKFDKQLLLEAMMAEAGAFEGVPAAPVASVGYIGLGATPKFAEMALRDHEAEAPLDPDTIRDELRRLVLAYQDRGLGYASRRAVHDQRWDGDHDHLARFGEWNDNDAAKPEDVG